MAHTRKGVGLAGVGQKVSLTKFGAGADVSLAEFGPPAFQSSRRFSLSNTTGTFLARLREAFGLTLAEAAVQVAGDAEASPRFQEIVAPIIERGRDVIRVEARKGAVPVALIVGVGVLALVGAVVFTGRTPAPARG